MKLKAKYKILIAIAVPLFILLTVYIVWGNSALMVSEITVTDANIPSAFDGYRIAHISDLHSASFGKGNERLVAMLAETYPDIIVITGDLFDYRWGDMSVGIDFAAECVKIAPTYFVSGNHEIDGYEYSDISASLRQVGVTVLECESVILERKDEKISLVGIDDFRILNDKFGEEVNSAVEAALSFAREYSKSTIDDLASIITLALSSVSREDASSYTILLAHRPEYIDAYSDYGANLVFSGHAHGGQFRLPIIGGLYAPGQGLFPKYTSGIHTLNNTNMIVSRGLGNSGFPFRFNNRPEIVVATLRSANGT